jgi:hypothetical protein
VDELQANPERAIATRELGPTSEGAALLFEYLDASRGTGYPGTLATNLFSIAVGKTEPGSLRWDNSTDLFDALRRALDDKPRDAARMFVDLAVSRGFLGALRRSSGQGVWPTAFRLVAPALELAAAKWPRCAPSRSGVPGRVGAPVSFQWALVSVDADGHELSPLRAVRGTRHAGGAVAG